MGQKLQPAVLGGLLIGVLSALPFVSMCCCLWVIAGGVLTTYLLQERLTIYPSYALDGRTWLDDAMRHAEVRGDLAGALDLARGGALPVVDGQRERDRPLLARERQRDRRVEPAGQETDRAVVHPLAPPLSA